MKDESEQQIEDIYEFAGKQLRIAIHSVASAKTMGVSVQDNIVMPVAVDH